MAQHKTTQHKTITRKKVGVLISGRGSNLKSLIEAAKASNFPAEITLVISSRPGVPGLDFAKQEGITTLTIDHKKFDTREAFEDVLDAALKHAGVDIICNAGFMRLLTETFVTKWLNKQVNIHPSLLPAFKGLNTHERVLEDGVKITGCSVHFVRTDMDAGPLIAQTALPVLSNDTAETLAARVLAAEHKLYPHALRLVAGGKVRVSNEQVIIEADEDGHNETQSLTAPPLPGLYV